MVTEQSVATSIGNKSEIHGATARWPPMVYRYDRYDSFADNTVYWVLSETARTELIAHLFYKVGEEAGICW